MIDFIKVVLLGISATELLNNPYLQFEGKYNPNTGETLDDKLTAKYKNLLFTIYKSGTITLSGSLHVFWNNGKHNYNDFSITNIFTVFGTIKKKFGIEPHQMVLRNLEIGINIIPPERTAKIIEHCFLHKKEPFKHKSVPDEGEYYQAEHSQYLIKIYNKAKHYRAKGYAISHEIMRLE